MKNPIISNGKLRMMNVEVRHSKAISRILFFISLLFLVACEEDITVDLPKPESKIVVDGYVEPNQPIYIILSRNAPYFDPISQSSMINSVEKDAVVKVSDGDTTIQLTEIDTIINGQNISGIYVATGMTGQTGKRYTLEITSSQGETLTASTNLLPPVPLDSAWFKLTENNDTLGFVWAHLSDPADLGNCYRWFAKRIGKDSTFISPLGGSFEDRFINGQSFDFAYNRGNIQNSTATDDNNEEAGFFKKGDSIVVKFCTMDYATYEFWRDVDAQIGSNGGPFSSPSNIKSNITGGLGCFAGYSYFYYSLKAQ